MKIINFCNVRFVLNAHLALPWNCALFISQKHHSFALHLHSLQLCRHWIKDVTTESVVWMKEVTFENIVEASIWCKSCPSHQPKCTWNPTNNTTFPRFLLSGLFEFFTIKVKWLDIKHAYLLGWRRGSEAQYVWWKDPVVVADVVVERGGRLQGSEREGSLPGDREPPGRGGIWERMEGLRPCCSCRTSPCQCWRCQHARYPLCRSHCRPSPPASAHASPAPGSAGFCCRRSAGSRTCSHAQAWGWLAEAKAPFLARRCAWEPLWGTAGDKEEEKSWGRWSGGDASATGCSLPRPAALAGGGVRSAEEGGLVNFPLERVQ